MDLRTYSVTLTGVTPLLMHWDNIKWADEMDAWKLDPKNKKFSKSGDDRSPAWRWFGCMYHDGQHAAIPQDNIMKALAEGGAMVLVPGGRMGKSFKQQSQSGMLVAEPYWPVLVDGRAVPIEPFKRMLKSPTHTFQDHEEAALRHGFELFLKRAKVGQNKHVRVRPVFSNWSISGTMQVLDAQITTEVLTDMLGMAGTYKGIGDWRPSSPKSPGSYGKFTAAVEQIAGTRAA